MHMRTADWEECALTYGPLTDPSDILKSSVERSDWSRCVMTREGEPVAVFGVMATSFLGKQGSAWMIATARFECYPRQSLQLARRFLPELQARFGELVNYVYHENHTNLRWLSRIGFNIHPAAPYGASHRLFHRVVLEADPCAMRHC